VLQAYSAAFKAGLAGSNVRALALFQRAVAIDPDFASAHAHHSLRQFPFTHIQVVDSRESPTLRRAKCVPLVPFRFHRFEKRGEGPQASSCVDLGKVRVARCLLWPMSREIAALSTKSKTFKYLLSVPIHMDTEYERIDITLPTELLNGSRRSARRRA
jgi:hypothetical protein